MIAVVKGRRVRQVLKINDDLKKLRKEIKELEKLNEKMQKQQIKDMILSKKTQFCKQFSINLKLYTIGSFKKGN